MVGALRDVGQNHLFGDDRADRHGSAARHELPTRSAMPRRDFGDDNLLTPSEIAKETFRAQYDGYRSIKGVDPKSDVETYFKVGLELSHPRWEGVPIFIEAGKRVIDPKRNEEVTEIEVVFKHEQPCLCALIFSMRAEILR